MLIYLAGRWAVYIMLFSPMCVRVLTGREYTVSGPCQAWTAASIVGPSTGWAASRLQEAWQCTPGAAEHGVVHSYKDLPPAGEDCRSHGTAERQVGCCYDLRSHKLRLGFQSVCDETAVLILVLDFHKSVWKLGLLRILYSFTKVQYIFYWNAVV